MDMYDGLARAYDELFPTNPATLDRLGVLGIGKGSSLLDLGCASGGHVLGMAARGVCAMGVDPSAALVATAIESAARQAPEVPGSAAFASGGMLDLGRAGLEGPYDCLLCLGNTLPHLRDAAELADFLARAAKALKPGGLLVLQILDYETLLVARPASLPDIQTEHWSFERRYRWLEDGRVEFSTRLVDRANANASEGTTLLSAFTGPELIHALDHAGFDAIARAGDWSGRDFEPGKDRVLAIEARKRA